MKKFISILLIAALILAGCSPAAVQNTDNSQAQAQPNQAVEDSTENQLSVQTQNVGNSADLNTTVSDTISSGSGEESYNDLKGMTFTGLDDSKLQSYMKNKVYSELVSDLNSEEYFVENVDTVYLSKEYLDELSYNSQANIYFGYTLQELDEKFEGARYIFTLGENGETEVQELKTVYDKTSEQVIRNVAYGGGVILICATVSLVSGGLGTSGAAVSMIFAASAEKGAVAALSAGLIGGAAAAITRGYQTHDIEQAIKAGSLAGSNGFKWGAITGAVAGGADVTYKLYGATKNGLTMNQAAAIQKESKYPLDVIKQFKSVDEYQIYKKAGLEAGTVGGKSALVRDIDPNYVSELGGKQVTNLERMLKGYAPIESATGKPYQLHHVNQDPNGTLAILTQKEHLGNPSILNIFGKDSEVDHVAFSAIRKQFWKDYAAEFFI